MFSRLNDCVVVTLPLNPIFKLWCKQTERQTGRWMDGWMDGLMNGSMDGWRDEQIYLDS